MVWYRAMRLVVIASLVALAACSGIEETILRCDDCFEITVDRVIDGDSLDTGRGLLRLYGADTPERGQPCYSKATQRMRQLAGDSIRIQFGPRATDQYGRLLAYAYTDDGLSIDEILIREGLATAWTRDGQHRDLLVGLEREARRKEAGCLW